MADKKTEEEAPATERTRMTWALAIVGGLIVLAAGYAVGQADGTDLVAADTTAENDAPVGYGPARLEDRAAGQWSGGRNQNADVGRGMAYATGPGRSMIAQGSLGRGPGLGPDGSGSPAQGNIERAAGEGPYGVNSSDECPFGITDADPNA
jgi:hypothetical protein